MKGVEGGDWKRGVGGERRRQKSLRIGVHNANAVVWESVYRTHLMISPANGEGTTSAASSGSVRSSSPSATFALANIPRAREEEEEEEEDPEGRSTRGEERGRGPEPRRRRRDARRHRAGPGGVGFPRVARAFSFSPQRAVQRSRAR